MKNFKKIEKILLEKSEKGSAWSKAVALYALDLLNDFIELNNFELKKNKKELELNEKNLLNGAEDWNEYSWNGCSFIYDDDIAKRICTKSEFKKTKEGKNKPNKNETWLDVQGRCLFQAKNLLLKLSKN